MMMNCSIPSINLFSEITKESLNEKKSKATFPNAPMAEPTTTIWSFLLKQISPCYPQLPKNPWVESPYVPSPAGE